jgi:DNA-binding IclR family transcriptional regulator
MSFKLQYILDLLSDGKFHEVGELQDGAGLSEEYTIAILTFLIRYEFAEVNREGSRVRIGKSLKKLLTQSTI